jgi:hypothetical protein
VSGSGVFRNDTALTGSVTALNLTGAAGYRGDISGSGITAITEANTTGGSNITINATQSFTGGVGNDTVTITANPTKSITGGGGLNTLTLGNTNGSAFTASGAGANISGFQTLGLNGTSGTVDYSVFSANNTIGTISYTGNSTVTVNKVLLGTNLATVASAQTMTGNLTYQLSDFNGFTDTVNLSMGGFAVPFATGATGGVATQGVTLTALSLIDAGSVGIANVNVTTDASVGRGLVTITTLTDNQLSNLKIAGTGALAITNLTDNSPSLTITDTSTSTAASGIGTLTDAGLASLTYSGNHAAGFTIGSIATDTATVLNFVNTNGGTNSTSPSLLTISSMTDNSAATVNLSGAVALTLRDDATPTTLRVTGSTDHANVSLTMLGSGNHTITLGNGTDRVVTNQGTDTITLGSGGSTVIAGGGADTVTVSAHSSAVTIGLDAELTATSASANSSGTFTAPGTNSVIDASGFDVYTGLQLGDKLSFAGMFSAANTYGTAFDATNITAANASYTTAGVAATGVMASAVTAITTLVGAGADNAVQLARGNYTAATKQFIQSTTGNDTIVIYDSNATFAGADQQYQAVVLVGVVGTSSSTVATDATVLGTAVAGATLTLA